MTDQYDLLAQILRMIDGYDIESYELRREQHEFETVDGRSFLYDLPSDRLEFTIALTKKDRYGGR